MNDTGSIIDHRDANIIIGYLPKVDFYPTYISMGKPLRFAVAFSCYYPSVEGHYFLDNELIANTCKKIIGKFNYQMFDDKDEPLKLKNSEAIDRLNNIVIHDNNNPIAYIGAWNWNYVGGPKDYHDRYTLEFFTSEKYFQAFLNAAKESLAQDKCKIAIIEYPQVPVPLSMIDKIKNFLS